MSIRNPFLRGHQIGWLWTLDRSNELSVPLNLLLVLLNLVPSHSFTSESTYGSIKLIITFQILISCVRHSAYLSPGLIHLWNVTGHITRRKNSDFIDSGLPSVSLSLPPFSIPLFPPPSPVSASLPQKLRKQVCGSDDWCSPSSLPLSCPS